MARKWLTGSVFLLVLLVFFWIWRKGKTSVPAAAKIQNSILQTKEPIWAAPDSNSIPANDSGQLIRYGKKLISSTARYFGPGGSMGHNSNGMNCQNCHLDAGTRAWAGNFGSVASLYPRFGDRRGNTETINQRITDCFERSMNGMAPDSNSVEMKAMNAYIRWVGKDVKKGKKPPGTGLEILAYIERAADPGKGKVLYSKKCQLCHGMNGEGKPDSVNGYLYPPLWGEHSYNTSAGLFRLSKFASFIKDNMPYGSSYINEQLTTEEAWDIAAFVNSQPRTIKKFKQDWPIVLLKPVDLPDGPFADSFPSEQHKYGPFAPIVASRKAKK
ncbi:MAG TPA: c-type cytochrome [Puia sp.]|jgi:thiosulfate dehydrogenase|nr:c-type cytochrome [Puia sp.]